MESHDSPILERSGYIEDEKAYQSDPFNLFFTYEAMKEEFTVIFPYVSITVITDFTINGF